MRPVNPKKMSREAMIKFLKGLQDGSRSVSDLWPIVTQFWNHEGEYYICKESGEKIHENNFENRTLPERTRMRTVVFEDYSK